MIDWFTSKIGLLVFIVAGVAFLAMFANMQLGIMGHSMKVQAANDLARLVDGVCENCTVVFSFGQNHTVSMSQKSLLLDGVNRSFCTSAVPASFMASAVSLSKLGGVVNVSAA